LVAKKKQAKLMKKLKKQVKFKL